MPLPFCAIPVLVSWPRNVYYLGFVAGFFLLGYVPFRLRRHPHAELIKLSFVVLDVALITAAVLNLPAGGFWIDWPIQTRTRSQNFLLRRARRDRSRSAPPRSSNSRAGA